MKAVLLIPEKYSIHKKFDLLIKRLGYEVFHLNYRKFVNSFNEKLNTQSFRLPYNLRTVWSNYYLNKINQWYIKELSLIKPNLIFVYNNEMLLPSTLIWLKSKSIQIVFFLGDNPLYTPTNPYNLSVLEYADRIFVPDTFWKFQLKKIGLTNVHHIVLPLPEEDYFPIPRESINEKFLNTHRADVFYAGMCYNDSWGYKKAKFLNSFTDFDLKIYGNKTWTKWFSFFPDLKNHFKENKNSFPVAELNCIFNFTKIIPVDGNPGILNGVHLRALEVLSSESLPLMEWNADLDIIFEGINDLPIIKNYNEIKETVSFYLKNEDKRKDIILKMKNNYSIKFNNDSTYKYLNSLLNA